MVFAAELLGTIWLVREGALDNDEDVIRRMTDIYRSETRLCLLLCALDISCVAMLSLPRPPCCPRPGEAAVEVTGK